ncbi:hypothetical protein Btru_032852 [Bulinus truncatus]|nr:hypothetical protein Btru_032852 [Bulinus truncatus]
MNYFFHCMCSNQDMMLVKVISFNFCDMVVTRVHYAAFLPRLGYSGGYDEDRNPFHLITFPSIDKPPCQPGCSHTSNSFNKDTNFSNSRRKRSLGRRPASHKGRNENSSSRRRPQTSNNNNADEEGEEEEEGTAESSLASSPSSRSATSPPSSPDGSVMSEDADDTSPPSGSPTSSTSGRTSGSSGSSGSSGRRRKKKRKRGFFASVWYSSPEEYTLQKMALWFPVGILLSLALYFAIIDGMDMEVNTKRFVGAAIGLILSLTFAFSVQMRCAMTLVVPTFAGKAGRTYISTFAIIYLINGPITNIMSNGKEIVRSLSCTSSLLANHTKTKWKLRMSPVENAFGDLAKDGYIMKRVSNAIRRAFKPLTKEIEEDDEENRKLTAEIMKAKKLNPEAFKNEGDGPELNKEDDVNNKELGDKVEKRWVNKMNLRCESVFNKGLSNCVTKMGELHSRCMSKLWILGYLLCWPLKITGLCNLLKLIPGAFGMSCQSMNVMNPGFGDTYITANAVIEDMDQGMDVSWTLCAVL